jgi:hypothetical protein
LVELMRTNDPVLLSWLEALLTDAGIGFMVLDRHTASVEGSIGALPRRVAVAAEDEAAARRLLKDAGIDLPAPPRP